MEDRVYEDTLTKKTLADEEKKFNEKWSKFKEEYLLVKDNLKKNPDSISKEKKVEWTRKAKCYKKERNELETLKKTMTMLDQINIKRRQAYIEQHGDENFVDFNTFLRNYFSKKEDLRKIIDAYEPTRIKAHQFDLIEQGEEGYNQLVKEVGSDRAEMLRKEYDSQKSLFEQMPYFDEKFKEEYSKTFLK